jgi:hypothetical protein
MASAPHPARIAPGVLLLCLVSAGCRQHGAKKDGAVMTDPEVFQGVELNTFRPGRCSPPEPDPRWRGVAIQAPRRVWFQRGTRVGRTEAFAAIPICGVYMLDVPFPLAKDVIVLVAVEKRTGRQYAGPVQSANPNPTVPPPEGPPLRKEDVKGLASGGYFNPNLADFAGLPEEPGTYDVYAQVRDQRSNVVMIEILEGAPK